MRIIFKNIICHRRKNFIMLLAVIFSVVLISTYQENIKSNEKQLRELADITPVECYITNLNGSLRTGLDISGQIVHQLLASEYTKDVVYNIRLMGAVGEIPENEWYRLGYNVTAVNSIDAVSGLVYGDINMADAIPVVVSESMSGEAQFGRIAVLQVEGSEISAPEAFFDSEENIVLLSRELMEENGWEIGDEIPITLYHYIYDDLKIYKRPLDIVRVKIAGQMKNRASGADGYAMDILLPAKYIENVFEEKGARICMDSVSFYLKDPQEINAAKKDFKKMSLQSRVPDAMFSYVGLALNMKDATFISLAGNIRRNILLLRIFTVPLCLLLFALSFLISFILMRNWRAEYVTMRLLGVYERQCMLFYCTEGLIISVAGVFLGNMITVFLQKQHADFGYGLLIIAACLVGTLAACSQNRKKENKAWRSYDVKGSALTIM